MTRLTRRGALALAAGLALPLVPRPALAFLEPVALDSLGVAIRGYDPVAYLRQEDAIRGRIENELETEDALWWFATAENRDLFSKTPEPYMPAFGGYCAWGLSRGYKRPADPTLWVRVEDRIYMHYTVADQNRWAEDIRGNIALGREHWKTLRDL